MHAKRAPVQSVTLHDLDSDAGEASITVSRALSRKGYLSPGVRDCVIDPNVVARALRRQSTKAVAVLLPDMAHSFSSELVPGDIAIAGFDDNPSSAYVQPALTTVEQRACRLIVRKSCGASA